MSKKIFITWGAGYVGSRLIPFLLQKGYFVTVFDIMHYTADFLPKNENKLNIIKGDIRDTNKVKEACKDHDYFLHLACISNDASFVLDEKLSQSVNFDCFEPMVIAAKKNNIKRFIYASSSSVYGISNRKDVKEDHPLLPLTAYNKFKGMCEPLLLGHSDDNFETVIFRPATVCGYGPRMRFDLSVNILTCNAICNNKIRVFGGDQLRPNLHILDYCKAVQILIEADEQKVNREIFNIGYENLSIGEIAKKIKFILENNFNFNNIEINVESSNDNRSYHINSDKIFNVLNFQPSLTIEDAVKEIYEKFKNNEFDNPMSNKIYYNVKTLLESKAS